VEERTAAISLPVAITVFLAQSYRAPETWARRAYRNLIYFHKQGRTLRRVGRAEAFSAELRAAAPLIVAGSPDSGLLVMTPVLNPDP
jgi:hypothetical protein